MEQVKTNYDKELAWKQALIFIGGLIITLIGVSTLAFFKVFGIIASLAGFTMLFLNIRAVTKSEQKKGVKIALLIPKIMLFTILLLVAIAILFFN